VLFEPHTVIAQVGEQAVANLGGALTSLAMGMKPIPPFLCAQVGHPYLFSRARKVSFANAYGADPRQ